MVLSRNERINQKKKEQLTNSFITTNKRLKRSVAVLSTSLFMTTVVPTFTVAKPKNPHKSRYICVYGDFFIFWYVDMHACVCLFSRRGEYLLTQAHPECR